MLAEGTLINDRYRVVRLIGEGGMGAVYEGEHTGVGRKVAIKVLHPDFARNQEAAHRFENEARAAAAIGNDHIIDVLDFGQHDGLPFMVMEYLQGESLGDRLEREKKIAPTEACALMGRVLNALGGAHAAGIIHRDLKPDNVFLIQKSGMRDFVKLLDFGISKFNNVDSTSKVRKGLTQSGALLGTPCYMAPEQALAKQEIDHRADLYSAGVMLYEMLTGVLPFDSESQAELLMQIIQRPEPVKPPHELVPEIPEELSQLVLKAIAKAREERFSSAKEFADALVPFGGAPIDVPPPAVTSSELRVPKTPTSMQWERASKVPSVEPPESSAVAVPPRKGPVAAVGVVALLAVVVGGVALTRREAAAPQPTQAHAATVVPVAPTPSRTVRIELEGLPSDAEILLDGERQQHPSFTISRGGAHDLQVNAPGRQSYATRFEADRDRTIAIALVELPPPAPAAPEPVAAATAEEPAANVAARPSRNRSGRNGRGHTASGNSHQSGGAGLQIGTEFK